MRTCRRKLHRCYTPAMGPAISRGFFLTFEGLDGSGKSTQLRKLAQWLEAERGEEIVITRQPGGTQIGDQIRKLLLDSRTEIASQAELGLMFSDRAQCIAEVIAPALEQGKMVLCDRFTDSTEAYQGGGRELGSELVLELHKAICGNLQPDLTLLLLPDFDRSLDRARRRNERKSGRGPDENRFEREDELFYRRVFDKYCEIARREPLRVVVIDGDQGIQQVHERIVEVVKKHLENRC
jgi:dTMP kinase